MSSCVGQDFWQGASAHLRHRAASRKAARSERVVGFTSSKLLRNGGVDWTCHWRKGALSFLVIS